MQLNTHPWKFEHELLYNISISLHENFGIIGKTQL